MNENFVLLKTDKIGSTFGTPKILPICCFCCPLSFSLSMDKQLLISTGIVKNASGSAYVELGNMKIICSVQGPRDSFRSVDDQDQGILYCDFKYAPFAQKDVYQPNLLVPCFSLLSLGRTEKLNPCLCSWRRSSPRVLIWRLSRRPLLSCTSWYLK